MATKIIRKTYEKDYYIETSILSVFPVDWERQRVSEYFGDFGKIINEEILYEIDNNIHLSPNTYFKSKMLDEDFYVINVEYTEDDVIAYVQFKREETKDSLNKKLELEESARIFNEKSDKKYYEEQNNMLNSRSLVEKLLDKIL